MYFKSAVILCVLFSKIMIQCSGQTTKSIGDQRFDQEKVKELMDEIATNSVDDLARMPSNVIVKILKIFTEHDKNGDRLLDRLELKDLMHNHYMSGLDDVVGFVNEEVSEAQDCFGAPELFIMMLRIDITTFNMTQCSGENKEEHVKEIITHMVEKSKTNKLPVKEKVEKIFKEIVATLKVFINLQDNDGNGSFGAAEVIGAILKTLIPLVIPALIASAL